MKSVIKFFSCKLFMGPLIAFCLIAVGILETAGQIAQPYRFERKQKNSDDYYSVINLGETGLALFRERDKFKNNNRIWELLFLDTTLKEKASLELEIKERHKMIGYEVTSDRLYFLFRTGETNKNDFVLIEVSYSGAEIARYPIKPDLDFRLTYFIKAGANFVFGGYVSNESVILIFEPAHNSIKVVPGFFQKDTELVDLRTNQNQTFNTVLIDRGSRGERKVIFRTFDETGKQLLEDVIPIDENISLQTGLSSSLEREDLMVAGTWGEKNGKQSTGFYMLSVNPFSDQKISYIDFGRLNHFVDYLSTKRAQRVKDNATENAATGRKPTFTSYVMPFRLAETKDGFYLMAEVYTPVGNSGMTNSSPFMNNPYAMPYGYSPYWPPGYYYPGMSRMYRPYMYGPGNRNASEVKTMSSVLLAFDADGKIKWDYSHKLDEMKIPGVEQVGDFLVDDNKVFLIYKKESELKVKTIVLDDNQVSEISEKVQPLEVQDVIRSEKQLESGVRHWFANSFYVWGYQTIKNGNKQERVRDVFYINRVDTF